MRLLLTLVFFAALASLVACDYFSDVAKRPGAKTTASGMVYFVKKEGTGTQKPVRGQPIALHYKAFNLKGVEVDSSYKRGHPVRLFIDDAIIPAWQEILPMMVVGDRWEVHVPYKLAFGEKGRGKNILPYDNLVYDLELVDMKPDWKPPKKETKDL